MDFEDKSKATLVGQCRCQGPSSTIHCSYSAEAGSVTSTCIHVCTGTVYRSHTFLTEPRIMPADMMSEYARVYTRQTCENV